MDIVEVNTIKENDMIKFITPDKKLVDGTIKKISTDFLGGNNQHSTRFIHNTK